MSVKWTTKGDRTVAHDAQGIARAVIYREIDRSYSVQKAVEWPGGARDWLAKGSAKTLSAAKKLSEV